MDYVVWLIVFVVFAALELVTLGLTSIWFAVGALVACITALFTENLVVQSVVFVAVTILVLIFVRPFATKYLNAKAEKTNVESMAGKTGKVVRGIDNMNATGVILVDGQEWTARSADGENIPKDTLVTIVEIQGVKAIVKKAE